MLGGHAGESRLYGTEPGRLAARKPSKRANWILITQSLPRLWLQATAGTWCFAFLCLALGADTDTRDRIISGELRLDHRVVFLGGVIEKADLIGKNTGHVFFVRPGETPLTIAPAADNVRSMHVPSANVASPAGAGRRVAPRRHGTLPKPVARPECRLQASGEPLPSGAPPLHLR